MAVVDPLLASFSEAPVTPEMIGWAFEVDKCASEDDAPDEERFSAIYRAMHAVAPVEVVSEGERVAVRKMDEAQRDACLWAARCEDQRHEIALMAKRVAELEAELLTLRLTGDAAETVKKLRHLLAEAGDERQALLDRLTAAYLERDEMVAARDARIAELKTILAQRPAAVPLGTRPHASDCAVHNEPTYRAGPCDCGAMDKPHNPFRAFGGDRRRVGS